MTKEEITDLLGVNENSPLLEIANYVLYLSRDALIRLFAKPWWEDAWAVLGAEIIRAGDGDDNYKAAYCIPGSDVKAHLHVVLERGDGANNYSASRIPGSDVKAHLKVILERGNGRDNFLAAEYIPEADKEKHLAVAMKRGYDYY